MSELGQALRQAREAHDMSLEDVQEVTKIQKRYLRAIEEGQFQQLPGTFYIRAFIKSYAEAVGLNSAEFFDTYESELPKVNTEHEVDLPPRAQRHEFKPKTGSFFGTWLPKVIVVLLIIGVVFFIWLAAQQMAADEAKENGSDNKADDGPNVVISEPGQSSDNQDKAPKDKGDKKNSDEKKQPVKEQPQLKLVKTEGNNSYFKLLNADQFVVDVKPKSGQTTWVQVRKQDANGKILKVEELTTKEDGTVESFRLELKGIKRVRIRVGSTPNTVLKVNGLTLDFPSEATVQNVYITYQTGNTKESS